MNAIELLEVQHKETLQMFAELKKSKPGASRKQTFKKMQAALLAHMLIEEELFYPSVAMQSADGEPIAEGYEEHAGARSAIDRCARAIAEEELFVIRMGVLEEMVKHHIKEERDEIFPRARKGIDQAELQRLGEEMEKRFLRAQKAPSPAAKLNRMSTARELQALQH